ncbi:IS110 family transposase [Evansella tamaricis]|uniref:IS110 family transposase n=1 Tax=Evansella tamaricis TaxID=2069301 RepID=A0ABS6JFT3_9BACI|nr:IS110 family transposase [Evansella tamaricis]MBU9711163.1 IS110 family transposase [Evansella tamaricis]MBU9711167.1 IS110 family transposase [Evansella tamaricis]MBU9711188.1 IS110 family transposase [Evansella tamaricis]MBU9711206.1 IS110 family transposase [Evansella tamaricis]MBU9711207.1 IS110 family transposase [Evansella tamaricis]
MTHSIFKHIQGKNGSRWAKFIKDVGTENILLVGVDAAKYTHKGMVSTYFGEIIVSPFEFDASLTGIERVKELVSKIEKEYGKKEIVVGVETTGHYYEDLVLHCHLAGFHVRIINSATTAKEREALLNWSKTDNLDLMAIIQVLINGHGTFADLTSGKIRELQKLTRARRELVKEMSTMKNLIRSYIDHIFREFQGKSVWVDGKREKVKPFSDLFGKTSRFIMRHYLHPSDILTLGAEGLRKVSVDHNLKIRDESIDILLDFAQNSISRGKQLVKSEQFLLNQKLDQFDLLDRNIKELEKRIEDLFIETDGGILLSVPGIGVVTGAELFAEMGDISDFDHAGQLIKMAGTNPIVKQSGDRNPSYYGVSKQGRRQFRNIVYQVGRSLAHNNPEMNQRYKAFKERGKHHRQAYVALGNRMIRLAFSMIRNNTLYRTNQGNYRLYNELYKKLHSPNIKRFYEKFVASETYHQSA